MPTGEPRGRRQKLTGVLVALITKEYADKRIERRFERRTARIATNHSDERPSISAGTTGGNVVAPFADPPSSRGKTSKDNERSIAVRMANDPVLMQNPSTKSIKPQHIAIRAANDCDLHGEDVADRNIARNQCFPPRVSSAVFVETIETAGSKEAAVFERTAKSEETAELQETTLMGFASLTKTVSYETAASVILGEVARTKARSTPLIPEDKYSVATADWNIMQHRSPMSESRVDQPKPLVIRKALMVDHQDAMSSRSHF